MLLTAAMTTAAKKSAATTTAETAAMQGRQYCLPSDFDSACVCVRVCARARVCVPHAGGGGHQDVPPVPPAGHVGLCLRLLCVSARAKDSFAARGGATFTHTHTCSVYLLPA